MMRVEINRGGKMFKNKALLATGIFLCCLGAYLGKPANAHADTLGTITGYTNTHYWLQPVRHNGRARWQYVVHSIWQQQDIQDWRRIDC